MAYYDTGYYYGSGSNGILARGIYQLQEIGVADVILPFILIFTIVFAVLQKTKILGVDEQNNNKPKKNFNAVIALVMALTVIIPHIIGAYPSPESDIVNIINTALPNISVIMVAVIMLLLIIGVFGGGVDVAGSSLASWAVLFAILATVFVFGSAARWWELPVWANFMMDSDTQALIVVILVFAMLIWFITKEDKPAGTNTPNFFTELGKVMGGGKK
jgi:hypothetical protein